MNQLARLAGDAALREMGMPLRSRTVPSHLKLTGTLDLEILEAAAAVVQSRHQALRVAVEYDPEQDTGRMVDQVSMAPNCRVFGGPDVALGDALAQANEWLTTYFEPTSGNMWRLALVADDRGSETHLFVGVDHLVCDGASIDIVVRDLANAYTSIAANRALSLPTAPSLLTFAETESRRLASKETSEDISRLAGLLAGASPSGFADLPLLEPLTVHPVGRTAGFRWIIDASELDARRKARLATGSLAYFCSETLLTAASVASTFRPLSVINYSSNRLRRESRGLVGWLASPFAFAQRDDAFTIPGWHRWYNTVALASLPLPLVRARLAPHEADARAMRPSLAIVLDSPSFESLEFGPASARPEFHLAEQAKLWGGPGQRGRILLNVQLIGPEAQVELAFEEGRFAHAITDAMACALGRELGRRAEYFVAGGEHAHG
ncbi:condensation domain-containing protein [Kribbella sp. NBC_00709]|uniref:condensation domain-containing protein n=1 Tax=Kribbella sp. NBC_00709 TaxID=2975972 RepID=UPI002E2AA63E|nr:condensation domain-containing protein [Kribbella sp. NBC_00709]